ncbi:GGDEF domain-containing protein [Mesorhizobium sp. BR1-1-16]|uniref:GGDEF domain-containing protein n=1 Tax=Mesorhizobium sp. BR1-1-16 TaxID=2876653 RepID=UPI001CCE355C|nr:GGDEF domain-containing protein [Mesorhizobium sp. BR1-1-16]MBZ9935179.1 GGDEF domain-containing protein [Mesorhizobium sp. BR1-1-16]
MPLDFTTLYVVILCNTLLMFIVWSVIYVAYDRFAAARWWVAACGVTAIGGGVLASAAVFETLLPIYLGNGFVIFGFCLYWIGVREIQGRPLPWRESFAITGSAMAVLIVPTFIDPQPSARNLIYAICQSAPLLAAIVDLRLSSERRAGSRLAEAGFALGILVHAIELTSNLLQRTGLMAHATYTLVEPAVVLLVVFSGMLWNFGLVLMVTDRLYTALRRQALQDELTGLPNRRAFDSHLDALMAEAEASARLFSLMIVDLDRFKEVNDTHGHAAGDACLVHVAKTIRHNLGPDDILARTGGDEFTILAPGRDKAEANAVAQRLLDAARATPFVWRQHELPATLSIGCATWRPGASAQVLERAADAALYMAKTRGRDRFAIAPLRMMLLADEGDEADVEPQTA